MGGASAWLLGSAAYAQTRVRRIVFLANSPAAEIVDLLGAFREGLREHGYTERQTITFEFPWPQGLPEEAELSAGLPRLKADLILAWGTPAVTAARRATSTLPIIMISVADPVGSGFIASLARPGGNVTGISNLSRDLSGKLLEVLVEVVPRAAAGNGERRPLDRARAPPGRGSRPSRPGARFRNLGRSARQRGRSAARSDVPQPARGDRGPRPQDAAADRLWAAGERRDGWPPLLWPQSARSVPTCGRVRDKILKGADPATLPVVQPTKFELVINVATAKAIGLEISPHRPWPRRRSD